METRNEVTNDLENTAESKPSTTHSSTIKSSWMVKALLLLAIGGAIFAIYASFWQSQDIRQQMQTLRQSVASLQTQQSEQIANAHSKTQADEQRLQVLEQRLTSELEQRNQQNNDWLLLKARYYLELAQINALWGNNLAMTSDLLTQADTVLENHHNPNLVAVRQAIAEEKNQISAIPVFDTVGVLTQLDAAEKIINELQVNTTGVRPAPVSTVMQPLTEQQSTSTWRERLNKSLSLLGQLVVVRHHDEEIQPLMTPAYEALVREQLRLTLQQVQWAVMQHDEALYQLNLKQALKKITQSFDANDAKTQTLLNQLKALQQKNITVEKPKISQSLTLLNQRIDANKTHAEDTQKTPTGASS